MLGYQEIGSYKNTRFHSSFRRKDTKSRKEDKVEGRGHELEGTSQANN